MKEADSSDTKEPQKCATGYEITQRALNLGRMTWVLALSLSKSTAWVYR